MRISGFFLTPGFVILLWLFGACTDDEEMAFYRLVDGISDTQVFKWGETKTFATVGENTGNIIVSSKPNGWTVLAEAGELTITAPSAVSVVVGTSGNVVLSSSSGGELVTIAVEIPTSAVINLSDPALFEASEVMLAIDTKGDTVAEVCREYVRNGRAVTGQGIRAVVVYLYDPQNKAYKRGFVATNGGSVNHDGTNYQSALATPVQLVYIVDGFCCGSGSSGQSLGVKFVPQAVADAEGNVYGLVKLGMQYWMRENLRTSKYNDGSDIGSGFGWYKDENVDVSASAKLRKLFGACYGKAPVLSGKLAPQGWRVAGDEDWIRAERYLGMSEEDAYSEISSRAQGVGDYLKSPGDEWADKGWGSNLSGLAIPPGGAGDRAMKIYAYVWSPLTTGMGSCVRLLSSTYTSVLRSIVFSYMPPMSVRCVREE